MIKKKDKRIEKGSRLEDYPVSPFQCFVRALVSPSISQQANLFGLVYRSRLNHEIFFKPCCLDSSTIQR